MIEVHSRYRFFQISRTLAQPPRALDHHQTPRFAHDQSTFIRDAEVFELRKFDPIAIAVMGLGTVILAALSVAF